jgi:hypothetical protein
MGRGLAKAYRLPVINRTNQPRRSFLKKETAPDRLAIATAIPPPAVSKSFLLLFYQKRSLPLPSLTSPSLAFSTHAPLAFRPHAPYKNKQRTPAIDSAQANFLIKLHLVAIARCPPNMLLYPLPHRLESPLQ